LPLLSLASALFLFGPDGFAQLRQAEPLTFDDGLIFQERGGNLSEKLFRRRRLILPKTVRCRPEVDADHAWLTPVKADSDVAMIEALVQMGVVDNEFVADVLAVDFTNPLFSTSRCRLLRLVPPAGPDFLTRFETSLKTSPEPAAKQLLDNLTDPKRDAKFHRQQAADYLDACQKRATKPEAAIEWFGLLAQRRAEVDREELSQHPRGHILESPDRIVFPSASAPGGRLDLTPACEARPQ
jgi:hypothetical protein